jgi:hypothetical protein
MAEKKPGPENESEAARTSRGLAEAAEEAEEKQLDETVPGGRYLVGADAEGKGGTLVDAEGKPLDKKKDD